MIEARLSVFNRLLRLSGRLDIVLSQVSQHASNNRGALGSGPKVLAAGAWALCRSGTCGGASCLSSFISGIRGSGSNEWVSMLCGLVGTEEILDADEAGSDSDDGSGSSDSGSGMSDGESDSDDE